MTRSADYTTYSDFKLRLRDHLDQSRATGRPLYVTTDGKMEAVVLSPETFQAIVEQADLEESLAMLDRSMDDIKNGRVRPAKYAIRQIAAELELPFDR